MVLFGDGAGAVVIGPKETDDPRDDRRFPLVVVRTPAEFRDADLTEVFRRFEANFARRERYALLLDTTLHKPHATGTLRRRQVVATRPSEAPTRAERHAARQQGRLGHH